MSVPPLLVLATLLGTPLEQRFAPPPGFVRSPSAQGSFAAWLRALPLKPGNPAVMLFDGRQKANQSAHAAVIDIDVGDKNLQQCADAVIRLRAEYLYGTHPEAPINFRFTSGDDCPFDRWASGERPVVRKNRVTWARTATPSRSRATFRSWLETVMLYAGTRSLGRDMKPVPSVREVEPGDVFITPGSPGHAVIVLDVAEHPDTRRRVILLAQSFMPAQEIELLINPSDPTLSPWYDVDFGPTLRTPEWKFKPADLRRF